MDKCIFCSIAESNTPPHHIVWQDEKHVAFLDINPSKEGHTLVIPKKHSVSHLELSAQEYSDLFLAAKSVSELLKEKLDSKLVSLIVEGLSVPHTHIHLIPLKEGEELAEFKHVNLTDKQLHNLAEKIRN